MTEHHRPTEAEIAGRLNDTVAAESPNRVATEEIRCWAGDYLRDYDEELAHFPDLAGQSHWNLWMRDARPDDALFAVLIFRPDGVEFFCGTGKAAKIKSFSERDFPESHDDLLAEMSHRFSIPAGSVRLSRGAAEKWLGRTW